MDDSPRTAGRDRGHRGAAARRPGGLTEAGTAWPDAVDLLAGLDGQAVVVGRSLGGRVAALAAGVRPDLVRGVVLEDPALSEATVVPPGLVNQNLAFLATFDHGTAEQRQRMRRESSWPPAEIDAWAECKPLVDRTMIEHLDLGDHTASTALNGLQVPALVVWDADGPFAVNAPTITNPLLRCVHLDGVGHCVRRDDPDAFHAVADPWLASLR